jgi:glucan phosphoethanolaminetransferase (alkaline phosphatase superfamily)
MRRQVLASVVKMLVWASSLCAIYALAPLDRKPVGIVAAELVLALLAFAALVIWQIAGVIRSPYPGLRAAEAVAVSLTLLILLFASTYLAMEHTSPASFTQSLTRFDAVYFTVTVFASVGFGDITAKTEAARVVVTIQMMADLVLIGVIAKVLFGAVRVRRQALAANSSQVSDQAPPGTPEQPDH